MTLLKNNKIKLIKVNILMVNNSFYYLKYHIILNSIFKLFLLLF